jgi:hypothetical protein
MGVDDTETQALQRSSVDLVRQGRLLTGNWHHATGKVEPITLGPYENVSLNADICHNWEDYKVWANQRIAEGFHLFRGHRSNKFHLQTTLHRAGIYDIPVYMQTHLEQFRKSAEAKLGKRYDLMKDVMMLSAFAQHYGYPSPLLDWTYSPNIAAFFALVDAMKHHKERNTTHVRVFALARSYTEERYQTIPALIGPTVTGALIAPGEDNLRLPAQQGYFLFTNIARIEGFIRRDEKQFNKTYLAAADIPVGIATKTLEDLSLSSMGISQKTMFPKGNADQLVI